MKQTATLDTLIDSCTKGERRAQEQLYHLFAKDMFSICLRYAPNTAEAEDILQNGFITIFNNIHNFKKEGSFAGWIRKIIVNTAISAYRKNIQWQNGTDNLEIFVQTYELQQLEYKELLKTVQELPIGYRLVFNMYAIEGYSHKEIAELLMISEGTSKSQLSRARKWLQHQLSKQNGGPK